MKRPFLSIIIANYNYGDKLEAAINSILSQDDNDYEIIIVDGASTDNSIDIIKKYEKYIVKWISEPDNGQSNAFNKGFKMATGDFYTWLNADDILLPGTIREVKKVLTANPWADWATGNFLRFKDTDKTIMEAKWGPNFLPLWLQGPGRVNVIFGPTTFWRAAIYEKLGPIDETLNYTMDVEYWARISMSGYKQVRVKHYCWGFRMHDKSKTAEFDNYKKNENVKQCIRNENKYISIKTGYSPLPFFRICGLLMRILDGSLLLSIFNNNYYRGKSLIDFFDIKYKL